MKLFRIFFVLTLFASVLTATSDSFAAADYYLKISDIKGELARVVHCPGGVCSIKDVSPGSFAIVVCDVNGKAFSSGRFALEMTFTAAGLRESPSKQSLGRESPTRASTGKTSVTEETVDARTVVSPRDAASGLPTGRRQHAPVKFSKEWDAASPQLKQTDTPTGGDNDLVSRWQLEVRVDRIEMK